MPKAGALNSQSLDIPKARDPSMQLTPTLGLKVDKHYLLGLFGSPWQAWRLLRDFLGHP